MAGKQHADCNYFAANLNGVWFCNKCGWGEPLEREIERLTQQLEDANKLLLFADGHVVFATAAESSLADMYAADCEWAQNALTLAGCWPRGTYPVKEGE